MGTASRLDGEAAHESCASQIEPSGEIPCICCGVCCTVYQVRVSPAEAMLIAEAMGLDYWDWVGRFCDPRWPDPFSHLIRHDDLGCVFLDHSQPKMALCRIYRIRPGSCRDWCAGIFKPVCQRGLMEHWQVSVDSAGRLCGAPDALALLAEFIHSL